MSQSEHSSRGKRPSRRPVYAVCAVLFMSALGGCASGPEYLFNVDSEANLADYRTFGFLDEQEPQRAAYQSVAHRHLKSAITREMQARGYQRSEQPDLLINMHLQRREDADGEETGSTYYKYRRDRYAWRAGVESVSSNYTEGTLNIDVVDRAAGALLWEGIAVGSVTQRMYENLEATIDTVTAKLFERFPKQPSSS